MFEAFEARVLDLAGRAGERAAASWNAAAAAPPEPTRAVVPDVRSEAFAAPSYYAVRLAMRRTWINRRNETFTFVDADTVRRRMSVDFTFPRTTALQPGDMALVPLMLLRKEDMRNLDVRDAQGAALPVLTYHQNGRAAVLGLQGVLERLVPDGHEDRAVDVAVLEEIVFARHAGPAREAVQHGGALDRQLRHAGDLRAPVEAIIEELERSFMLLVETEYQPGQRLVHKLSYDSAIRPQPASFWSGSYVRANRTLSSFGLMGRVEFFSDLAVGLGESYHCEIVPPRDTFIAEAALAVRRQGCEIDDDPITDSHRFRPHLHAVPTQRGDAGKLSLIIHAHRGELVMPLAFSSVLISIVLAFFPSRSRDVDGQTLAALLLVPFALSAYYIRSQENSYVTRMLRGVRLLALLPPLAALSCIGLVGLGTLPRDTEAFSPQMLDAIRAPFVVAAGPSVVLLLAVAAPTVGGALRKLIRAEQRRARRADRRRQAEDKRPRTRLRGGVQLACVGVLMLSLCAALGYSGWCALTTWWEEAIPPAAHETFD